MITLPVPLTATGVIRETIGPLAVPVQGIRKNKSLAANAAFFILGIRGGNGTVILEGTNDIDMYGVDGMNAHRFQPRAKDGATWAALCTQTNRGETATNSTSDYAIIRVRIRVAGPGFLYKAQSFWV